MTAQGEDVLAVEYLYGIDSSVSDDSRFYQGPRVVRFRITKKTPKRIYYVVSEDWEPRTRTGFVDRQRIETDGEIYLQNRHWSSPDFHLYLAEPVIETAKAPTMDELKAAMRAAHPDMGGSHEAFLAAHQRYERARKDFLAKQAQEQTSPSEGGCLT